MQKAWQVKKGDKYLRNVVSGRFIADDGKAVAFLRENEAIWYAEKFGGIVVGA